MRSPSTPFGPGSVSLGLYSQGSQAQELLADLMRQAREAAESGFDGLTLAEHHGGFPAYLPNPGQVIGWMLHELPTVWGAACPILLTLRSSGLAIEETAWLAARFPGRVGLGLAPGYYEGDFAIAGTSFDDRTARFNQQLPEVVAALSGRASGPIAADPAVQLTAMDPIPTVSAAVGPVGARRAARAGSGVILGAFNPPSKARRLFETYAEAGGRGPRLLIRRVWVGEVPADVMDELARPFRQLGASYLPEEPETDLVVAHPDPVVVAARLARAVVAAGADSLSVRFSLPGFPPEATMEQITRFGLEVLPRLRQDLQGLLPRHAGGLA